MFVWLAVKDSRRRQYEFLQECRSKGIYPFNKQGKRIATDYSYERKLEEKVCKLEKEVKALRKKIKLLNISKD